MKCDDFIPHIIERIESQKDELKEKFEASKSKVGTRHVAIDNLLPESITNEIHAAFAGETSRWRFMDSFREKKFTSKDFDKFNPILKEITFALQHPKVIKAVEEITGQKNLVGDESLYAGGLSMMEQGHFLDPHIDNSHDGAREHYRRLNVLFYVTPDWKLEDGGHLELWNKDVTRGEVIESRFNRLVLMETTHLSWHSVNQVQSPGSRCCVSNYYFSKESPLNKEYFHVTGFMARPGNLTKRLKCRADNFARNMVRKVFKQGLGKTDVYRAN